MATADPYQERDSRPREYAGRLLDKSRWIAIEIEEAYSRSYEGQVALLTAASLLSRMTPSIRFDIPNVQVLPPLPWARRELGDLLMETVCKTDPFGRYQLSAAKSGDYRIFFGRTESPMTVHGNGWEAYVGPGRSPVRDDAEVNPIGAALAATMAAAETFKGDLLKYPTESFVNALTWDTTLTERHAIVPGPDDQPGSIWVVGTGAVGTAILFFLTLFTRNFSTVLIDGDSVKEHNLYASPIFLPHHVDLKKVDVVREYLNEVGVQHVQPDRHYVHESVLWTQRPSGTPDILVSTANEFNVRSVVESAFPPIQIYATTGRNWQIASIRHMPLVDPCSLCLFPETHFRPSTCAIGSVEKVNGERTDASLPFLSFAAGVMAAAEILKASHPGYPLTQNRVVFNTQPTFKLTQVPQTRNRSCSCGLRSATVHRQMITGSKYALLSG